MSLHASELSSASKHMDHLEQTLFPEADPSFLRSKTWMLFTLLLAPGGPPPKESPTPAEPPTTLPSPHLYPCPRRCVVPLPADWFRESWPMGSKGKSVGMLGGSRSSQNGRQRGESSLLASECHCGSLTSLQPFGDCEEGMGQGAKEGAHKEGTMAWRIPGLPSWNSPNLEHWGFCQMNVFIV